MTREQAQEWVMWAAIQYAEIIHGDSDRSQEERREEAALWRAIEKLADASTLD